MKNSYELNIGTIREVPNGGRCESITTFHIFISHARSASTVDMAAYIVK